LEYLLFKLLFTLKKRKIFCREYFWTFSCSIQTLKVTHLYHKALNAEECPPFQTKNAILSKLVVIQSLQTNRQQHAVILRAV